MIIDFHTHIWPAEGGGDRMVAAMDERNIDMSVVMAIEPSRDERISSSNRFVLEQCGRFPERLLPFCSVDPAKETATADLEHWVRSEGCRGLKLHPPLQGIDLGSASLYGLVERATELGVPVLVHTGPVFTPLAPLIPNDLYLLDDLASALPEAKLVLAHADPLGLAPVIAGRHENVYLDTAVIWPRITELVPGSGRSALQFMSIGGVAGWKRLVFGSDANPRLYERVDAALESISNLELDKEKTNEILGGSAARLLELGGESVDA